MKQNLKYKVGDYVLYLGKEDKAVDNESWYIRNGYDKEKFVCIYKITEISNDGARFNYKVIRDSFKDEDEFFDVNTDFYTYSRKISEEEVVAWCI